MRTRHRAAGVKKNEIKPWQKKQWCSAEVSCDFVAAMEEVLDLYGAAYDAQRPKVNFDEARKQLLAETREPIKAGAGQGARYDYEYERNGTHKLFMFVEPQAGWRHSEVTARRTMLAFAPAMKWLGAAR